jgi:general secretion pathway protein G
MTTRSRQREQGFTFTEVLIVLAVIFVMTAVFVPTYLRQVDKAKDAAVRADLREITLGLSCYSLDHDGVYPVTVSDPAGEAPLVDADGQSYLSQWPTNPWTGKPMRNVMKPRVGDFWYSGRSEVASTGFATPLVAGYVLRGWLDHGSSDVVRSVPRP